MGARGPEGVGPSRAGAEWRAGDLARRRTLLGPSSHLGGVGAEPTRALAPDLDPAVWRRLALRPRSERPQRETGHPPVYLCVGAAGGIPRRLLGAVHRRER